MGTCSCSGFEDGARSQIQKWQGGELWTKKVKYKYKSQANTWDSPKVATWLELLGLQAYYTTFLEHGVNGPTLLDLTEDQITRGLKITRKTHIYSLMQAIEDLRTDAVDYDSWEWTCLGVKDWLVHRGLDTLVATFVREAVHGGVLFRMTQDQFINELDVGRDSSPLVIVSLMTAIRHAEQVGRFGLDVDRVSDWGPTDIYNWLCSLHLPHLDAEFRSHAIHGTLLLKLDQSILQSTMGLSEIQAIVIARAIKRLQKRERKSKRVFGGSVRDRDSVADDLDSQADSEFSDNTSAYSGYQYGETDPNLLAMMDYNDLDQGVRLPTDRIRKDANYYFNHNRSRSGPVGPPQDQPYYYGPDHRRGKSMGQRRAPDLYPHPEGRENVAKRANIQQRQNAFSQRAREMQNLCGDPDYFRNKLNFGTSPHRGHGRPDYSSSNDGDAPSPSVYEVHRDGGPSTLGSSSAG